MIYTRIITTKEAHVVFHFNWKKSGCDYTLHFSVGLDEPKYYGLVCARRKGVFTRVFGDLGLVNFSDTLKEAKTTMEESCIRDNIGYYLELE